MNKGAAMLIAGAVGAVLLPTLTFGAHLPLWVDAAATVLGFGGTYLIASRGGNSLQLDEGKLIRAKIKTARELMSEGARSLERLKRAGRGIRDRDMRRRIKALYQQAARVMTGLRADPLKAMSVRRLLTFYLPNAASVAEGWRSLEVHSTPSQARIAETRAVVQSLGEAFVKFSDEMVEPQLQTLDLDLRVLNDALRSDLERT